MLLSELSKRRIRSVAKLLKVGRIEMVMVLRADYDKGYIDLSKRRVDSEEAKRKEEQFAKAKCVHGIMRHVADALKLDLEDFCMKFSWPLYKDGGNAFDMYRRHINEDINIWDKLSFAGPGDDLSERAAEIKEAIDDDLRRRLLTQMLRMQVKIDVSCTEYEGIEAIKTALLKGLAASKEECEVKIKLIAHPTFSLTCMCRDKVLGFKSLEECTALIQSSIEGAGGAYSVRAPPAVVGGQDDQEKDKANDDDSELSSDSESEKEEMPDLDEAQLAALREMQRDA